MKAKALITLTLSALCLILSAKITIAQQTASVDVPRTISYQGMLTNVDNTPLVDGTYPVTVSLYADPTGSLRVWQDTYSATVVGGVFSLYLGSGNVPLPDPTAMNTQLWIGTQVGDAPEMHPLTPLAASPYALNVPDRAITTDKLADGAVTAEKVDMNYVAGLAVNGRSVTGKGSMLNITGSDDIAISYDDATNTLRLRRPSTGTHGNDEKSASPLAALDAVWSLNGDGWDVSSGSTVTPAAGDFIGTTNNLTFEMKAFNQTAMRYQPSGGNTPNIVGGSINNTITSGSVGSVIAGGGTNVSSNFINSNASLAVIGGGSVNEITADESTIGGGTQNYITGTQSVISGGHDNIIYAQQSVIGGGYSNTIPGNRSAIVGGEANTVSSTHSIIGGGKGNLIIADSSFIGSGSGNKIRSVSSAIGGGNYNTVDFNADYSTVGGGKENRANGPFTTIPGGEFLEATSYVQTAIGCYNAPRGTHTSLPFPLAGTAGDDPIFMVGNGKLVGVPPLQFADLSNAFEVSYNGHSVVYDLNGSSQVGIPGNRAAIRGATYTDNILYAWGDVEANGTIFDDFGVARVIKGPVGVYTVELNIVDPETGNPVVLNTGAIVATLSAEGPTAPCSFIHCSRLGVPTPGTNQFQVYIHDLSCQPVDLPFMFHVTGRPGL